MLFKKNQLHIFSLHYKVWRHNFDTYLPPPNVKVTGECGHQPHVRVWDVHDRSLLVEFPGHKYGINCVVSVITSLQSSDTILFSNNQPALKIMSENQSHLIQFKIRFLIFPSSTSGSWHFFWIANYWDVLFGLASGILRGVCYLDKKNGFVGFNIRG